MLRGDIFVLFLQITLKLSSLTFLGSLFSSLGIFSLTGSCQKLKKPWRGLLRQNMALYAKKNLLHNKMVKKEVTVHLTFKSYHDYSFLVFFLFFINQFDSWRINSTDLNNFWDDFLGEEGVKKYLKKLARGLGDPLDGRHDPLLKRINWNAACQGTHQRPSRMLSASNIWIPISIKMIVVVWPYNLIRILNVVVLYAN